MNPSHLFSTLVIFFFLFIFQISVIATNPESGHPTTLSSSFSRDGVNYYEDNLSSFSFHFPHSVLDSMIEDFNNNTDPIYDNSKIAGFCFIPQYKINSSDVTHVHFQTIGFRVVLTLFDAVDENVDAIRFYTFDNLRDPLAHDFVAGPGQMLWQRQIGDALAGASATGFNPANTPYEETREFDFVFLDIVAYDSLATGTSFYQDGVRPGGEQGVILERLVATTDTAIVNNIGAIDVISFRSLVFWPLPKPEFPNYESEAALTFEYGKNCPPYWRDEAGTNNVQISDSTEVDSPQVNLERTIEFFFKQSKTYNSHLKDVEIQKIIKNERDKIQNQLWFQILMGFLGILGFLILIAIIRSRSIGKTFRNLFSIE